MTPLEIQFELRIMKIQQKDIARDNHVSTMSISKVINKRLISDHLMRAVAAAIKKDHRYVFPEYYLAPPKRKTSKVATM